MRATISIIENRVIFVNAFIFLNLTAEHASQKKNHLLATTAQHLPPGVTDPLLVAL
jgi:hypothetical protein